MKQIRITLFVMLLILVTQPLQAQFSVGLLGNLSSSNISGDAPPKTKYSGRTGFGHGVILDYKVTDDVTLSLQPMFLPKGTTISYDLPSYKEERDSVDAKFSYITIPLMVKVNATKVVYVTSGFDIGFLQSATATMINVDGEKDITDKIQSTDISVNFGVGFTFKVSSFNLFFEGRYSQGLYNTSNFPDKNENNIPSDFKNTGMQLLFGALYNF
ncbi:MAG: PorT family protein [Chlorobi bacterium]|nr:PorT family protein [Chlorobiota bacterium]